MGYRYGNDGAPDQKVRLCCVGDGGVGKTCLLMVYAQDEFPEGYTPTVFENYVKKVAFRNQTYDFSLWDTAGQEDFDRLRPLSYVDTNVILICFASDYPVSLVNVEDKWHPEVSHFCPGIPVILVATKTDLRENSQTIELLKAQGRRPVSTEEGQEVARRIGASYTEVSAMHRIGVDDAFGLALSLAIDGHPPPIASESTYIAPRQEKPQRHRKKCHIL